MKVWKRIHIIPDKDGYVIFFCDDIEWKKITQLEKDVVFAVLNGDEKADILKCHKIDEKDFDTLCDLLKDKGGHPEPQETGKVKLTLNLANVLKRRWKVKRLPKRKQEFWQAF